jgi:TonB family protein
MFQQITRFLFALCFLTLADKTTFSQRNLNAKANLQPVAAANAEGSDRVRDGLIGPVRRIRTEVVKLITVGGRSVEDGKRVPLETAEYDLKGTKTANQYFPVAGSTLTGREVYQYDEKGNISEMILMSADGTVVSKEVYKYEFDSLGNWVKMTTSVAVVENDKIEFEPTEVTYRAIFYYLDANTARMLQPASGATTVLPSTAEAKPSPNQSTNSTGTSRQKDSRNATALPPSTSVAKLNVMPVQMVAVDMQSVNLGGKKVEVTDTAPPLPQPLSKPASGGVLNGMALSLPAPVYPDFARRMRVTGVVEVEVILDEAGKVISAKAVSGPGSLRDVAVQAAYRARFSPTKLSGQPVKVSGQIDYKFSLP